MKCDEKSKLTSNIEYFLPCWLVWGTRSDWMILSRRIIFKGLWRFWLRESAALGIAYDGCCGGCVFYGDWLRRVWTRDLILVCVARSTSVLEKYAIAVNWCLKCLWAKEMGRIFLILLYIWFCECVGESC